jgi:hypothetical protein
MFAKSAILLGAILLGLVAIAFGQQTPSKTPGTLVDPVQPKITCGTCRTSTSITLDWEHNAFAKPLATYYNVHWRIKKPQEETQDPWKSESISSWDDVTVQATIGCCTGCEQDMQATCSDKNLQSSTVYEIIAESVYFNVDTNATETNPSAPLEIPTGQDYTSMPRSVASPTSVAAPVETICSLLGVSGRLSCCGRLRCFSSEFNPDPTDPNPRSFLNICFIYPQCFECVLFFFLVRSAPN